MVTDPALVVAVTSDGMCDITYFWELNIDDEAGVFTLNTEGRSGKAGYMYVNAQSCSLAVMLPFI